MRIVAAVAWLIASVSPVFAQTASDQIRLGNTKYAALEAAAAFTHFEAAAAADSQSYEAAWKASRSAMDMGGITEANAVRATYYRAGERYARRAIALNAAGAEGRFSLARALGKAALEQSPRGKIRYATEIRKQALECLKIAPRHAGCLHVMGVWNAEVMRLNGFTRAVARNILGGRAFGSASWNEAVRYMEAAVAEEPARIAHRIDLAEIYLNVGQTAKARAEFETARRLPPTDLEDRRHKTVAESALRRF